MKAKSLGAGKHADGQGLWLVKRDKDAGKWVLRIAVAGKRREMGLGRWPDVSIAEAREKAADARKQVRDGIDPVLERTRVKRAPGAINSATRRRTFPRLHIRTPRSFTLGFARSITLQRLHCDFSC